MLIYGFVNYYVHDFRWYTHTHAEAGLTIRPFSGRHVGVGGSQLNKFKQLRARGWASPGEQV